jgi:hypothetical protein
MTESRFRLLEIEMLRRKVAPHHVRRAVLELQCHHLDLIEQALARGATPEEAELVADEALGSDAVIIERYLQQKELQSRAQEWSAGYVLAPLLGFAGVFFAVMVALIAIVTHLSPELHHMRIPAVLSHDMGVVVSALFLWVIPVSVAMAFGVLAGRQHVAFRWLSAGVVILSIVAAQMNVQFDLTGGSPAGLVDAGIGFSTGNMPHELLHALTMAALALIPAAWLRHWAMSRGVAALG